MNMMQLSPMISVETPLGHGLAIIFEANEEDNYWTVALDSGAIVTYRQASVLLSRSYTHGRGIGSEEMRRIIDAALEKRAKNVPDR